MQIAVDCRQQGLAHAVAIQQVAKLAYRGLVGLRFLPQVDAGEGPHGLRVIKGLFHGQIRQVEPQLHEIDAQHALQVRAGGPFERGHREPDPAGADRVIARVERTAHVDDVAAVEGEGHERQYLNYDFQTWTELAELQRQLEPERHDWVRTVRQYIAVPRVVRLLGYDRLPTQVVKLNRRNLFSRDRNRCQYCGDLFPTSELSIDHVRPRSQGGPDTWENLVCACVRCNARKGGRTPDQASMSLKARPVRPKRNPLISVRLGQEKYHSWKAFLDHAYWSVELK